MLNDAGISNMRHTYEQHLHTLIFWAITHYTNPDITYSLTDISIKYNLVISLQQHNWPNAQMPNNLSIRFFGY
jgi:hypothetical protein